MVIITATRYYVLEPAEDNMRVVGYMRTDKVGQQARRELQRQHEAIETYCKDHNLTLLETFWEVALGEDIDRNGLYEAMMYPAEAILVETVAVITDHKLGVINLPQQFKQRGKKLMATWTTNDTHLFDTASPSFADDFEREVCASAGPN